LNILQSRVNQANIDYRIKKLAIVIFQETPIVQTRKGLIRKNSTVDYIGVYSTKGRGVAFDAKECESKTAIPLKNFKQHQLLFLQYWEACGGDAFFLVHFKKLHSDLAYKTPINLVTKYFTASGRKSIPINEFNNTWLVPINDYLQLIKNEKSTR
jgi:recombination protein U